jgi:PAS domain S-box-containing protein
MDHLEKVRREQELRREAEEQLRILVESSPAAILTIAGDGTVLAANRAADGLFLLPPGDTLRGRAIHTYLPVLTDALQMLKGTEPFRTAVQSQGRRQNGEIFMAHTWFSSYRSAEGMRLAAIVVDSTEEMRDREEQGLRQLIKGNRIAAAAVAHEVRNLSAAISVVCSNLREKHGMGEDEDFKALATLVSGLERTSSLELQTRTQDSLAEVELREVLDDLRIVIEPDWREINGKLQWDAPPEVPLVLADRQGLLQAFLNLVQNSLRAVQESDIRELAIVVSVEGLKVTVRFQDTGPGIAAPERLFQPFQPGADGTGLGLYISRAEVRSYGGELRFEPRGRGACFAVELQVVGEH